MGYTDSPLQLHPHGRFAHQMCMWMHRSRCQSQKTLTLCSQHLSHQMAATPVDAGEAHELLTPDDAKHSFCGIMFDLEVLKEIPVDTLTITSVSVRGSLGPMAVYSTPGSYCRKHQQADQWTQHYPETEHDPSDDVLKELEFDEPLVLKPGDTVGMYVHSTQRGGAQVHYGEFDENNPELHNATRTDQFIRSVLIFPAPMPRLRPFKH